MGLGITLQSENWWFKPHLVLHLAYQTNLVMRLSVTFGSNSTMLRLLLDECRCRVMAVTYGVFDAFVDARGFSPINLAVTNQCKNQTNPLPVTCELVQTNAPLKIV